MTSPGPSVNAVNPPEPGTDLVLFDEHALDLLHVIDTGDLDVAPEVQVLLQDAVFRFLLFEYDQSQLMRITRHFLSAFNVFLRDVQ